MLRKGQIFYADLDPVLGSEQGGIRPVVIVQNNKGNICSPTVLVAPLTNYKNPKKELPVHLKIKKGNGIKVDSIILLEQIRVIDKTRLGHYIKTLNKNQINEVEKGILISFDIKV